MSNELKVGLLTIISLAVFYAGFSYLKGKGIFSNRKAYYVKYDNVQGLVQSSPVYFLGLNVGIVEELRILESTNSHILAKILVDDNVPINKKSIAKISSTGLISDKAITIVLNNENFVRGMPPKSQYCEEGDTLIADIELDITSQVALEVRPVREKADKMMGSIDSILNVIKGVFDQRTQNNIISSVESVEGTLTNFEKTTSDFNIYIEEERARFDRIITNVESITKDLAITNREVNSMISQNTNRISNIMENADKMVANIENITADVADLEIQQTITNLQMSLDDLDKTLQKVNDGEGSLALLLNDDQLYRTLDKTTKSLDFLINDLKDNPKKYVQFSLIERKRKRDKDNFIDN